MKPSGFLPLLILLFISLFSIPCLCAADPSGIDAVRVDQSKTGLEITASLSPDMAEKHKGELIYLLALSPSDIAHPENARRPVSVARAGERLSFEVPLDPFSRIFSYFSLALPNGDGEYSTFGTGGFVSNPGMLAQNTEPYPAFFSKKGLQVQMLSDAQLLGVSHTTLNVALDEFLLPAKDENAFSFLYCGQTYYLNREKMELLDYRVRTLSEAGVNVILDLILTNKGVSTLPFLYYEGVTGKESSLYAICLSDPESEQFYEGFLRYLTERYTREDRAYGFAGSFILGYEVNAARYRNYMGSRTVTDYAAEYARLYRVTDAAIRSVYSDARIYIPIANNFSVPSILSSAEYDPNSEYTAKEFLTAFNAALLRFGSFPWRVSINAYPSDPTLADFRLDGYANTSDETPIISVKNIEVLAKFLSLPEMCFGGAGRHILIGEFGVSGKAGTEEEEMQAALFAYSYYKILSEPQIDAMIWHRQMDHPSENGLYFGLWSTPDEDTQSAAKKKIWRVFRLIDTDLIHDSGGDQISGLASLLGEESFASLFPSLPEPKQKILIEDIPLSSPPSGRHEKHILFDFTQGDRTSFFPSDNARFIEIRDSDKPKEKILFAELYPTENGEYRGIGSVTASAFRLLPASVLTASVRVDLPERAKETQIMLRLLGEKKDGTPCVFEGIAHVSTEEWVEICFDMSDFSALVDLCTGIRIWIPGDESRDNISLSVKNISLYVKSENSFLTVLFWISVILALLVTAALLVGIVIYVTNRRKRLERRERRMKAMSASAEKSAHSGEIAAQAPSVRRIGVASVSAVESAEKPRRHKAHKVAHLHPHEDSPADPDVKE